ncbi:MAG: glutamate 5-kinase [Candidatus Reconcilbacillus cellulovorans]|uniref:Glutamate 5-kinase n=1 Tax=Candidatus Reconcilbacillus cellulovorans TaxID=1906605 RepID=A0A2A6E2X2_9BACL|nr:MAG: glutamate 5-kinase [Candidatus Reconcilbacillus cellulovorans]
MRRIVIKIGSSSLTGECGGLDRERVRFYAKEISRLADAGFKPLVVTSGAVAAGFRAIGYPHRPRLLREKQAAAAVGQGLLMKEYAEAFAEHDRIVAQLLLTRSDLSDRRRMQNALAAVEELLVRGVVPVINENDTVAVDELKFGDNDTLSALVAALVKAEQLVIATDTDGLYTDDPRRNPAARKIERVGSIDDGLFRMAGGSGSAVGTGGMRSKLEAARIAVLAGIEVFVGRVAAPGDLELAVSGRGKGTYFEATGSSMSAKKRWIGFHSLPKGAVDVDDGAAKAITEGGKSLLPAGVRGVDGDFHPGDVVEVRHAGRIIGRGVVNYEAAQLRAAAGLSSEEVKRRFDVARIEVIHRDEWVAFETLNVRGGLVP